MTLIFLKQKHTNRYDSPFWHHQEGGSTLHNKWENKRHKINQGIQQKDQHGGRGGC